MVGEGVLIECPANPNIIDVLKASGKPNGILHPKVVGMIDFLIAGSDKQDLEVRYINKFGAI